MAGSEPQEVEQLQARIRELESENRRWMRLAGTNRLTNLPNSLMLYQVVLPAELKKDGERDVALACTLIAPDGLGEINQEYGRAVGDQLIVQIGAFFKEQIETHERLFHPDGANFAILINDATEGRARRKAVEIKSDFKEEKFTVGKRDFKDLTCSAGVTTLEGVIPAEEISTRVDLLYQELSNRLHRAKQRGGDTVIGLTRKEQ